jgi:hypothetical protein
MEKIEQNKWIFSKEEIENLPSYKDGIDEKKEFENRKITCSFIQECGMELKIAQLTIATACCYFQRFYALHSFKSHDKFVKLFINIRECCWNLFIFGM